VLYALRYPFSFAVLVVAFIVGIYARGAVQHAISGQRRPAWARQLTRRRSLLWLKPYVDPYGCIAAVIGGPAWGAPVEGTSSLGRPGSKVVGQLIAGPITLLVLGIGALEAFRAWTHLTFEKTNDTLLSVYHGNAFIGPYLFQGGRITDPHFHYTENFGQVALFLAGVVWLTMGVLAIMPLPPLDGGRLLFALGPRTMGWQRARFRLDDENWGTLILLILALPVLFRVPLLIKFLGYIVDPVVRLIA